MGLFSRMLLFFMLLAIGEYAIGIQTPATSLLSGNAGLNAQFGYNATNQTQGSWWSSSLGLISSNGGVLTIIGVGILVMVFAGFGFILPTLVYIPVAVFFLAFVTYPQSLIYAPGMPSQVTLLCNLFYAVLNVLFVYALISWLKGQE
jgi:hypothetical protein